MDYIEGPEVMVAQEQQDFTAAREDEVLQRLVPIGEARLTDDVRREVESIVGFKADVVVVLAGGVKLKPEATATDEALLTPDYYVTPLFTAGTDNIGLITGARYRGVAAAIIAQIEPDAVVQTNSVNRKMGVRPVDVVAREMEEMGVAPERIIKEGVGKESESTFGNVARLIEQLGTRSDWGNVAIVTNKYHLDRVTEIVKMVLAEVDRLDVMSDGFDRNEADNRYIFKEELTPEFVAGVNRMKKGEVHFRLVACEDVIGEYDPEFKEDFAEIQKMAEYKVRVKNERQGLVDFQAGVYRRNI